MHLTEAERRAWVLADNKLALNAGWDREKAEEVLARHANRESPSDLLWLETPEDGGMGLRLTPEILQNLQDALEQHRREAETPDTAA